MRTHTIPTILVVDDDEGILEVIDIILTQEKYHVEAVRSEDQLQEVLKDHLPSLILLDVLMSGVDGREISRHLKSNPKTKNIPIIIMSANTKVSTKAEEAHADGYLQKPFDINELLETVRRYI